MNILSDIAPTSSRISTRSLRRKFRPTRAELRQGAEELHERIHKRIYAMCEDGIPTAKLESQMRIIALDIAGITALAISIHPTELESINNHRAFILTRIPKVLQARTYWQRRHWLMELHLDLNHAGFLGWPLYTEGDAECAAS
jgi:hypothetical protein